MGLETLTLFWDFAQELDPNVENHLTKLICTVSFIAFLCFLSCWYRQSVLEERFDPVKAAHDERDDALRAWAEMGTKHERALETVLKLHDESSKNFKDLPYLTQRNYELAEENIVQHNEIERLKFIQRQYEELQDDVSAYGMTAKRPETYQRECESLQRRLLISDRHLLNSEKTANALRKMLEAQKATAKKESNWLRAKLKENASRGPKIDTEIDDLRAEKTLAEENSATKISSLDHDLSDSRKDLVDARKLATEREEELGRQKARIDELESNQSQLKTTIEQKDLEIQELEDANQEMAKQPAPESTETSQRFSKASADLDQLRHQYAECKRQSEARSARISELEATMTRKDNRIATLEEQISRAPTTEHLERQNQSHNEAMSKKDQDYQALRDLHNQASDQLRLTKDKYNANLETLNTVQQNDNAKLQDLQRLWSDYQNLRNTHANCEGQLHDLRNQLRQGGNAHTDLQIKYNTQATDLDTANKNVNELTSKLTTLQQATATLEQKPSSYSDSDAEKYRLEGENRVRPTWQANFDREMSVQALKLEKSQGTIFKLQHQLQQAKNQASPLREMQLKSREDAVKAREDALTQQEDANDDIMDHDHLGGPNAAADEQRRTIKSLEAKLSLAKKEVGDARLRVSNFQRQLGKEKKEREEEKGRHDREMKREKEDFENRSKVLKLRLETENPLKRTVSKLQSEIAVLRNELKEKS